MQLFFTVSLVLSPTNLSHDLVHKTPCKNNWIIHAIFLEFPGADQLKLAMNRGYFQNQHRNTVYKSVLNFFILCFFCMLYVVQVGIVN